MGEIESEESSLQHPKHAVSISAGNAEKTGKWLWLSLTLSTSSPALLEGRDATMLCRKQSWIFPWLPFTELLRKASVRSGLWIGRAKLNHTGTVERGITCKEQILSRTLFLSAVFMQLLTTSAPSCPTSEFVGLDSLCLEVFSRVFLSLLTSAGLQSSEP